MMNNEEDIESERNLEMYKLKRLINRLDNFKG